MTKYILWIVGFFSIYNTIFGQAPNNERMLFIIDSIPLIDNPEDWNPIIQGDIADVTVLRNQDTIKQLGWGNVDGITYIFTKEYRSRPDYLKKIPSLKQMALKNGTWNLHDTVYTGKYIDYYNSGRKQNEGMLINGKLNGELKVYFKEGGIKSVTNYKDGILNGVATTYYKNGAVSQRGEHSEGKMFGSWNMYFINGQVESEQKLDGGTGYDTALTYYSTGKIKAMKLIKNGAVPFDKKVNELNFYADRFNQSLNAGDTKEANMYVEKISRLDSSSADTYFKRGILMFRELRFDRAIAEFDKALEIEPLMRESLTYRGLARIKKYQFLKPQVLAKSKQELPLTVEVLASIPAAEQEKICSDLQQAEYVDFSEYYVNKQVPEAILNYCKKAE